MSICIVEFKEIVTADGEVFHLTNNLSRWVMSHSGMGMPPINRVTERGYGQDGATVVGRYLGERLIALDYGARRETRAAYWQERADLADAMRINRGGPFIFRVLTGLGQWREIVAELQQGLTFEKQGAGHQNYVEEPLVFVCGDPVWYGDTHTHTALLNVAAQLVFPIVFDAAGPAAEDIWFGSDIITLPLTLTYPGTWQSRPTVTLRGPAQGLYIVNTTLDVSVGFTFTVPAGVTVTIAFTNEGVEVTSTDGLSYSGYMTRDSAPIDLVIAPHPTATNGVNVFQLYVGNATADTRLTFSYRDRYVAI